MKKIILILMLILGLFIFAACDDYQLGNYETDESSIFKLGEVKNVRIVRNKADVKSGLSEQSPTIASLNKGERARVLGESDNFYVIRMRDKRIGSLNNKDVEPITVEDQPDDEVVIDPEPPSAGDNDLADTPEPEGPANQDESAPANQNNEANDSGISNLENQMIELINKERQKEGLAPLRRDSELTRVARIKANDMERNNYFSHYSPTYGSPFDMLDRFDVEYIMAGENLSGNSSVETAHQSLMQSSGHRANILKESFTHIGIGAVESSRYRYIFVQLFIKK